MIKHLFAAASIAVLVSFSIASLSAAEAVSGQKERNLKNPIFQSSLEFMKNPTPVADSAAVTEADMKAYDEKIPGTDVAFKMVPIKGGKFLMGSPADEEGRLEDEGPQVEVEIKPFWMEEHETTWKEFEQFALKMLKIARASKTAEPSAQEKLADALANPTAPYNIGSISHDHAGRPGYPASGMTVYAGQVYCKWLTMLTGRYYRLPTEAEWEYACRAGTKTAFSFGKDAKDIEEYAWTADNSENGSNKVKQLKPNAWGLYDMHGNLAEWVLEQYAKDTYSKRKPEMFGAPVKPAAQEGFGQIARGGHCDDDETANFRSARRLYAVEAWKLQDPQFPQSIWWVTDAPFVGFRVVRPLDPPKTEEEAKIYEPNPKVWLDYTELNQRE